MPRIPAVPQQRANWITRLLYRFSRRRYTAVLEPMADAVRTRVLRLAALDAGALAAELVHSHVSEIDRLVTDWHGQKWVDLPGPLRAVRRDGVLRFERPPSGQSEAPPG